MSTIPNLYVATQAHYLRSAVASHITNKPKLRLGMSGDSELVRVI